MTDETLDRFDILKRLYAKRSRRWSRHPYVLEKLRDAGVDSLLRCMVKHDPGKIAFAPYLWYTMQGRWIRIVQRLHAKTDRNRQLTEIDLKTFGTWPEPPAGE